MTRPSLLHRDLDEIIDRAAEDLRTFHNANIFITGGTGFIGTWLLETLHRANEKLSTHIYATVLTRSPETFQAKRPHLAGARCFRFISGDVRSLPDPKTSFDAVIHAATSASAKLNIERPDEMFQTIVEGAENVLAFASQFGSIPLLFTSSGAVHSSQGNAYAQGKRIAEQHCLRYTAKQGLQCKIARLFAFVGPYLPLDEHFAIGNFIGDALRGDPILIKGDGTTVRSYLYPTDMITWLLAIFARGQNLRPYNVGSMHEIDMRTLAAMIATLRQPQLPVIVNQPPQGTLDRYVPDTSATTQELNVREAVPLEESLSRTFAFYRTMV